MEPRESSTIKPLDKSNQSIVIIYSYMIIGPPKRNMGNGLVSRFITSYSNHTRKRKKRYSYIMLVLFFVVVVVL